MALPLATTGARRALKRQFLSRRAEAEVLLSLPWRTFAGAKRKERAFAKRQCEEAEPEKRIRLGPRTEIRAKKQKRSCPSLSPATGATDGMFLLAKQLTPRVFSATSAKMRRSRCLCERERASSNLPPFSEDLGFNLASQSHRFRTFLAPPSLFFFFQTQKKTKRPPPTRRTRPAPTPPSRTSSRRPARPQQQTLPLLQQMLLLLESAATAAATTQATQAPPQAPRARWDPLDLEETTAPTTRLRLRPRPR